MGGYYDIPPLIRHETRKLGGIMQNISVIEYESESKDIRSNLWTFCIYPDSWPENYLNIIDNWHIPVLISPLHDSDVNGNGMEKKPHIHVMIHFGARANKSYQQVMKYVEKLHGCPCEVVHNSVGMIRYFIHRDNPEKAQYKLEDLKAFCGFEYLEAFETSTDENMLFAKLEDLIDTYSIFNYYQLVLNLKDLEMIQELNFLRRHSTHIRFLLTDKYQILKRANKVSEIEGQFLNNFNL